MYLTCNNLWKAKKSLLLSSSLLVRFLPLLLPLRTSSKPQDFPQSLPVSQSPRGHPREKTSTITNTAREVRGPHVPEGLYPLTIG